MAQARRQRGKGGPGRAQWLAVSAVASVILGLTFALGVLVGRQVARHPEPVQAATEPAKRPGPVPRRSGLAEPAIERPVLQEKLTFYQTLTAPLSPAPASTKAELPAKPDATKPGALERGTPPPGERPAVSAPPFSPARPDKPAPAAAPPPVPRPGEARPTDWTVQVGAFKERGQAESMRKPLAAAGLDAYLSVVPADDGQARYKVRVGGFKTREEAVRMAERIRQERSLTAFVTPR